MNLYTFTEPNGVVRRFTSAREARVLSGNFQPTEIRRSQYRHDVVGKKTNITITTPENGVLRPYLIPSTKTVQLTIANMDGIIFWRGRLASIGLSGAAVREIRAVFVSRKLNPTLHERRIIQRTCPYELYGRNCRAKTPEVTLPVVITYDSQVIVDNMGGEITDADRAKYLGGIIQYDKLKWWISKIDAHPQGMDLIAINTFRPLEDLIPIAASGMTRTMVKVFKGCNRTINDCQDVHNNVNRFGGWNFAYTSPFGDAISGA